MRLLTLNMIQCNVKTCSTNKYPLSVSALLIEDVKMEYNKDFLVNLIPKIDWNALNFNLQELGWDPIDDPVNFSYQESNDSVNVYNKHSPPTSWWESLHQVLLCKRIVNGKLECRGCQHVFVIKDTILSMIV
jgi:multifunctional methyltransferase subunit TRM112